VGSRIVANERLRRLLHPGMQLASRSTLF
jgi:hypothetical protein